MKRFDIFSKQGQALLKKYTSLEKNEINELAYWITKNWYKHPTLKESLTYKGICLGEPLEYEVIKGVLNILVFCWREK